MESYKEKLNRLHENVMKEKIIECPECYGEGTDEYNKTCKTCNGAGSISKESLKEGFKVGDRVVVRGQMMGDIVDKIGAKWVIDFGRSRPGLHYFSNSDLKKV